MHLEQQHRLFIQNLRKNMVIGIGFLVALSFSLAGCQSPKLAQVRTQTLAKPKHVSTRLKAPRQFRTPLTPIVKPKPKPRPSRLFALLIGTTQFTTHNNLPASCCVQNDLEGLEEVLVRDLRVKRDNILTVPSRQVPATVDGIRSALLMHLFQATEKDRVLVWFAGQALSLRRKGKRSIVLKTEETNRSVLQNFQRGEDQPEKVLTAQELSQALRGLNTNKTMVFLDIRGRGSFKTRSFVAGKIARLFRKDGHFVVTSNYATSGFRALPYSMSGIRGNRKGYGVLAYTLMESLAGKAKDTTGPRRQPDQWLDHREVLAYVKSRYQQLGSRYGFPAHTLFAHDPLPKRVRLRKEQRRHDKVGMMLVTSTPSRAVVWVDGQPEGETPLRLFLSPGDHKIVLRKQGYSQYFQRVRVLARQKHTLSGNLRKLDPLKLKLLSQFQGLRQRNHDIWVPKSQGYLLKEPEDLDEEKPAEISKKRKHPPGTLRSIRGLGETKAAYIPPGSFYMGSTLQEHGRFKDEDPRRRVTLNHGFWMMQTEVTQAQFRKFRGYNPSHSKQCGQSCPVEQVTWHEALAFANKLSRLEGRPACFSCTGKGKQVRCKLKKQYQQANGKGYLRCKGWRLPAEAEWEFAARAGSHQSRYGQIRTIAWYSKNTGPSPMPVKQKLANPWNLHDMLGNVYELCWDWYRGTYLGAPQLNPIGPSKGKYKVIRGGSWVNEAENVRNADRFLIRPTQRRHYIGFRLVRSDN
ncbi:MAG: PEGA domain-containing protein [Deltaproteobacteria bacterium]|nr:MAG: PEGA domain-containing protein [Deltaproteobacteria bacterium]